ncbi:hypothetical protein [Mycoplasma sp. P36-A1]|uniref:hypothetical protein n=1 Tax=Mycoplasma sp. P36-A1 TaxID=3252900 RepID=UPI003C2D8FD7
MKFNNNDKTGVLFIVIGLLMFLASIQNFYSFSLYYVVINALIIYVIYRGIRSTDMIITLVGLSFLVIINQDQLGIRFYSDIYLIVAAFLLGIGLNKIFGLKNTMSMSERDDQFSESVIGKIFKTTPHDDSKGSFFDEPAKKESSTKNDKPSFFNDNHTTESNGTSDSLENKDINKDINKEMTEDTFKEETASDSSLNNTTTILENENYYENNELINIFNRDASVNYCAKATELTDVKIDNKFGKTTLDLTQTTFSRLGALVTITNINGEIILIINNNVILKDFVNDEISVIDNQVANKTLTIKGENNNASLIVQYK